MKTNTLWILLSLIMMLTACNTEQPKASSTEESIENKDFQFLLEQFADLKIMRYQVPGFDDLSLKQKTLIYYLSQAALSGRDIIFDQNYRHNLVIRKTLEGIYKNYEGSKDDPDYKEFEIYLKRVWFSNGIHHHYSTDKFKTGFSEEFFRNAVMAVPEDDLPLEVGGGKEGLLEMVVPVIFDPSVAPKRVSLDPLTDLVKSSAANFYEGVSEEDAVAYYNKIRDLNDPEPISYGLNSKLVKKDDTIMEKVYKVNGMYNEAIRQIVFWLEKAVDVAENDHQRKVISTLIEYYKTGDLKTFDRYNVLWVKDLDSRVDFVNGFIEVYGDPLGMKATWESVVNFKDIEATRRTEIISRNAQWFEDHSPVDDRFKKEEVKGVSAKVITVAQLGGDCYPATPIGINLPNPDWIRKAHGSKSVTMENITYAYDQAALGNGFLEEFCYSEEEIELARKYGPLAGNLHTDLHECLGHGSGQLLPETSPDALKNYGSVLEESRADLFALYYIMDDKMVELGIMPTLDVGRAEYNSYIRNGLMTQLTRIEMGKDIEQAHMRNRQLISKWCFEKGKDDNVIEEVKKNGKTYYHISDYGKLRQLFGELLAEVQRIKSEGDYEAGKQLVEKYAVKVDPVLHKEVKERFGKLNIAPYGGFINPTLEPVMEDGEISDIRLRYEDDYTKQMLEYSQRYSFLPAIN